VLDDHHLLFRSLVYDRVRPTQHRLVVRDLADGTDTEIARLEGVSAVRYDAGTRVLAVAAGSDIVRYRLALSPVAATPLRRLAHAGALRQFRLTDPALADGVVAVVDASSERGRTLVYRIAGEDRGPPVTPEWRVLPGSIAAVDRAGAIYVVARGVEVYRGVHAAPQRLDGVPGVTAISHDGTLLAAGQANDVTVFDAAGAVRWRHPVWRAGPVVWSLDDRTLFVAADGGAAISFDAASGERLAIRCGWGFGLHDRDLGTAANMPSACAAP
jgi:hypothetical protein